MLRFHALGNWPPGSVRVSWTASTHRPPPHVLELIEQSWQRMLRRPGIHLFDGPMCRLESWTASPQALELVLSRTSYKPFLGTNLERPELADELGWGVLANPVGASSALVSSDGWLLMGRRSDWVAYHPRRIHPFAGALEPRPDLDVFDDMQRELHEELSLVPADIASMRCLGLVEDVALRQPELIFQVNCARTRAELEAGMDGREHRSAWAVRAEPAAVQSAIASSTEHTPVGIAAMTLWLRGGR